MIRYSSLLLSIIFAVNSWYGVHKLEPQTVNLHPINPNIKIEQALRELKAPEKQVTILAKSINSASTITDLSPLLITALIYTESTFHVNAVSNKGYKGLLQTPDAIMKPGWQDIDILIGCKILKEKLKITNNNLEEALTLYKGGRNKEARRYALRTIEIFNRLQKEASNV